MGERPKPSPLDTEPIIPQEGDLDRLRQSLWNSRHRIYYPTVESPPSPGKVDKDKQEEVKRLFSEKEVEETLTSMEIDILRSRYLGEEPESFGTISNRYHLKRQSISNIERRALKKLRGEPQEE